MTPADMSQKLETISMLPRNELPFYRRAVTDPSADCYVRPAFEGEVHALAERERVLAVNSKMNQGRYP